jgi:hypothetical protein
MCYHTLDGTCLSTEAITMKMLQKPRSNRNQEQPVENAIGSLRKQAIANEVSDTFKKPGVGKRLLLAVAAGPRYLCAWSTPPRDDSSETNNRGCYRIR